jgi:hypothetical protein
MFIFDKFQNGSINLQIEINNIKKNSASLSASKFLVTATSARGFCSLPKKKIKGFVMHSPGQPY